MGGAWAGPAAAAGLGAGVSAYSDLAALAAARKPAPQLVAAWLPGLAAAAGEAGAGEAAGEAGPSEARSAAGAAEAVRRTAAAALDLLQEWLGGAVPGEAVLVVVTSGAVAAGPGDTAADVAGAAVWGLVRSAQAENPGRLVLADVDGTATSWQALAGAARSGEPELAIRAGRVLGRRLTQVTAPARPGDGPRFTGQARHTGKNMARVPARLDQAGTVLVTGAPGTLGELTAAHLAATGRAGACSWPPAAARPRPGPRR